MSAAAVEIRTVGKRFGGFLALDCVSLTVPAGGYVVLLGPSGSGKTTLLSIIGGFLQPDAGTVLIGGQDMAGRPPARRPTATVFQDYALFPHMTVGRNVAFGLRMQGMERAPRAARVQAMLDLVGLTEAHDRRPHQLSGGQRQRVALARALAVAPALLLLDEPLGALDLKLRRQMQAELKAIQARIGTTFLHVTHDQEEAMALADLLVVMNAGRIEDAGPPERVYLRPRTLFAASFMGESNLLPATVACRVAGRLALATPAGPLELPQPPELAGPLEAGDRLMLSIRPEHLLLAEPEPGQVALGRARIEAIGFLGAHRQARLVHLAAPELRPVALLPQASPLAPGAEVPLAADSAAIVALRP